MRLCAFASNDNTIYIHKVDTGGNLTTVYKVNMALKNGNISIDDMDIPWIEVGADEYIRLGLYMYYLVDTTGTTGLRKYYFLTIDIETLTKK